MLAIKSKKCLAVQVGRNRLTVTVYTKAKNKLTVYHTGHIPLQQGMVRDGEIMQVDVVSALLRRHLGDNSIDVKDVVFSIYHSRIMTREVELPVLPPAKMKKLIEANVQDYFPVDIKGYVISHKVKETVVERDIKKAKVFIVAVPEKIINQYVGLCEILELQMMGIDYQENSVLHFAQMQRLPDTHMLMHIDYECTTVTIHQGDQLAFIKTLPLGVAHFRQAIKDQYRVKEEVALERLFEQNILNPAVSSEIEEEVEENYLQNSIDHMLRTIEGYIKYYNTKDTAKPIQNIYITGSGANVCEIVPYVENNLGITTQKLSVFKGMTYQLSSQSQKQTDGIEVTLGAAFFDYNVLPKQISEVRQRKERSSRARLFGILMVVLFASILAAPIVEIMLNQRQKHQLEREIAHYEYIEMFKQEYEAQQQAYESRAYVIEQGNTKSNELIDFIEQMEKTMPTDVIIQSVVSNETGIELQVQAENRILAANFLTVLKETERFATVYTNGLASVEEVITAGDTSSQSGDGTVQFAVTCSY